MGDLRERRGITPSVQIQVSGVTALTDGNREHGAGTGVGVRAATIWTYCMVTVLKPLTMWSNAQQLLPSTPAVSDYVTSYRHCDRFWGRYPAAPDVTGQSQGRRPRGLHCTPGVTIQNSKEA